MNLFNTHVPKVYLVFMMLLLPFQVFSQSYSKQAGQLKLSLAEATELAMDQNFSIEQAGFDVDKTRSQYQQSNAVFLPQFSFEYNVISTDDPLNVFGFKLKQEVVTRDDFNPDLLRDPDTYENYSAKFEARQPLFNPDKMMERGAVKSKLNSATEQLRGTKNFIRFKVRQQYYNLILHQKQLDVLNTALETASEHRRQAQNFLDEGLISREDFLAAKVYELEMESRILQTENDLKKVREELALLLGVDGSVSLYPTDDMQFKPQPQLPGNLSDFELNNAQTRALDHQVSAAQKMVKSAGFSFLPSVNLFGSYEFNDDKFVHFDASSYMIGANLRWNLFSGFSNAGKVMEAKADYRKAKSMQERHRLDQENKVRQAVRSLNHAKIELELTEETIEQSTQNAEIRTNRYEEGLEKTTDLLEAETQLAEAKLKNVMALFKYNMSIAALEMLLERDFKKLTSKFIKQ